MAALDAAREDLHRRFRALKRRLADPSFLANRGLGNEVGIYTICYDPALELEARDLLTQVIADESLPCRVVEHNLYDIALARLEARGVLAKMPTMERKHDRQWVIRQMEKVCPAVVYAQAIADVPREPGDVMAITGVGEVYPFLRLHTLLDNIQPLITDAPIVALYPGRFDGKSLRLFGRLEDENYYRAFDLV